MSLVLIVSTAATPALVGGPIPVTVAITNRGDAPVEVPSPDAMSPYEFSLRDMHTGDGRYALSAFAALSERNQDSAPAPHYEHVALDPGATLTSQHDLGALAPDDIAPGAYLLSVSWHAQGGAIESAAVPLTVQHPTVIDLGVGWCPGDQALTLTLAHITHDNQTEIYQRSGHEEAPLTGELFARDRLPAGVRALTVATALSFDPCAESRWYATIGDNVFAAGVAQRATVFKRITPTPLPLPRASLYEVGWQTETESASFLAAGLDAAGHFTLLVITCHARAAQPVVVAFPTGIDTLPATWCASAALRDEGRVVDVVLAFANHEGTAIARMTLWPDSGASQGPVTLATYPEAIASVGMAPVAVEIPGTVDLLFGPTGVDGRMSLARIALDGSATLALWQFLAPAHHNRKRPDAWVIPSANGERPVVLAHIEHLIVALRVGDDAEWHEVASGHPQAYLLHVVTPDGVAPQALWCEPSHGFVQRTLDV